VVKKCFSESEQAELDPYAMMHGIDLRSHRGYALLNKNDKVQVDEAIDFFHNFGIIGDRYYGDDGQERFRSYDDAESLRNDFVLFGAMRRRIISRNPDDLSDFAQWSRGTSRKSAAAWLYAAARDFVNELANGEPDLVEDSRLVLRHFEIIFEGIHLKIAITSQNKKKGGDAPKEASDPRILLKRRIVTFIKENKGNRSISLFLSHWENATSDRSPDITCLCGVTEDTFDFESNGIEVNYTLKALQDAVSRRVKKN
jgi:hypothetical protein